MELAVKELDRAGVSERLAIVRKKLRPADEYLRGHAWAAVGVAVATGALIGFLAGRR
jgi:ElaB/YqjD/DUF883 family membrane-anchored ribosome-binding protein